MREMLLSTVLAESSGVNRGDRPASGGGAGTPDR